MQQTSALEISSLLPGTTKALGEPAEYVQRPVYEIPASEYTLAQAKYNEETGDFHHQV